VNMLYREVCDKEQTLAYDIAFQELADRPRASVPWRRWALFLVALELIVPNVMSVI
jgi:hypothetical protein